MQVIIEGPDGSGKTTLVEKIKRATGWTVVQGEGPEKYPGEILIRIKRMLKEQTYAEAYKSAPRIFDRHSCVSHPIFSQFTDVSILPQEVTDQVYDLPCLIIYCQAPAGELNQEHEAKDYDSETHLKAIASNHKYIVEAYDAWALKRAHLIYRFWEEGSMDRILRAIIHLAIPTRDITIIEGEMK